MSSRVLLLRLVLVATAYLGAALAGKMLAFDPLHASPLWPGAGFALAALLIWGPQLWPGVWLGSFLFNFLLDPSVTVMPLAAGLASGATLAALLGARLTRRFFTPALPLTAGADLWRFLLLAGPLSCLVSATVAMALLHLGGRLGTNEIISQWLLWWVGDSSGVVLFAPILLTFWPKVSGFWSGSRGRISLQLIITALLLIAGHLGLDRLEEVQARMAVNNQMEAANELGFHYLPELGRELMSIERLFAASEDVTSQEFATFTTGIVRQPTILAVDWAPRVAGNERQAFEAAMRQKGSGTHIFDIDANNQEVLHSESGRTISLSSSAPRNAL